SPTNSSVSSLRAGLAPSSAGSSDRLTSQSAYHVAQSSSAPSTIRKTRWWVSAASCKSSLTCCCFEPFIPGSLPRRGRRRNASPVRRSRAHLVDFPHLGAYIWLTPGNRGGGGRSRCPPGPGLRPSREE